MKKAIIGSFILAALIVIFVGLSLIARQGQALLDHKHKTYAVEFIPGELTIVDETTGEFRNVD